MSFLGFAGPRSFGSCPNDGAFRLSHVVGEFFGGLGLVVGFLTRFSAASITLNHADHVKALLELVHAKVGFSMSWTGKQAGEGFEYHLMASVDHRYRRPGTFCDRTILTSA
jgi:uncharacterized membrane protein YphA (DoxX/SURF4 family)